MHLMEIITLILKKVALISKFLQENILLGEYDTLLFNMQKTFDK